jgi:prolipoprotein diacylglyceryltransferase
MVLYGALRLGVSFLRLDDIVLLGLRTAQLIGIASMALALPAIIYLLRTPPQEEELSEADEGLLTGEEGAEAEPAEGL